MMRNRPGRWSGSWRHHALLLALLLPVRPAPAAEVPQLVLPQGRDWLEPGAALVVQLPPALAAAAAALHLELDAVDVTDLALGEGAELRFQPPQPLEAGRHELRLTEFRDDGEIVEQGVWTFEVRRSAHFQEMRFSPQAEVAWQSLVADRNLDPAPDDGVAQVAAGFDGALANPGYRLEARNSLVHDSSLGEDRTQLYDFLFRAGTARASLQLGQQAVGTQSLIMEDFTRRGLSGSVQTGPARLTAFALRTDTATAFADALAPRTRDQLTAGLTASVSPWRQDPERLVLSATWLKGRGSDQGVAELGNSPPDERPAEGGAWSLALDSRLLDQQLRLYAEAARSRYDFDGAGTGFAAEDDGAYRLGIQYRPQGDGELDWAAGLQWQQVGSFFRSLANAGLPGDKRLLNGTLALARGGLSANLLLGLERDNLDDRAEFPTIRSRVAQLDLAYSMATADDTGPSLFANPTLQLSYARMGNRQIDSPALYTGDDTDNINQDLALGAAFAPGTWSWSLSYQFNRFDDDTGVLASTRSDLVGVDASVPVGDWLTLSPALQVGRGEDRATGAKQDDLAALLGLALALGPVTASLDYSFTRSRASDDSIDAREQVLALALNWNLLPARAGRPGLDLFMNANWSDSDAGRDAAGIPLSRQVYLGLRAALPTGSQ